MVGFWMVFVGPSPNGSLVDTWGERSSGSKKGRCYQQNMYMYTFKITIIQKCIYIYTYIWVNHNISLTWIKAIWGWFPLSTMIPVRENSEVVIIYPDSTSWGSLSIWKAMGLSSLPSWYLYNLYKCHLVGGKNYIPLWKIWVRQLGRMTSHIWNGK